ncbi:hypothetical protein [Moraxella lacunata]
MLKIKYSAIALITIGKMIGNTRQTCYNTNARVFTWAFLIYHCSRTSS